MKTFKIYTFGCKTNRQESDYISQELKKIGFVEKEKDEKSDYTIINSCTVTSNADDEVLYFIRKQKKIEPNTKIILTGCLAQVKGKELSQNPDIEMVLGNSEKLNITKYISNKNTKYEAENLLKKENFDEFTLQTSKRTRATLKIQDGCNSFCAYCIVPYARGKSRSSHLENIIENINNYVNNGYKEIVLSAIHLGLWGKDLNPKRKLIDLLKEIEKIEGLKRYRLGSLNPSELDEEMIEYLISSQKVCNHLHISLQSATNKTLENMNRHYKIEETIKKLEYLTTHIKSLNIGADVIVGFPGETKEDFAITIENLKNMPINYMHIFPYSKRQNTKAAEMSCQISETEKKRRAKVLKQIATEKQEIFLQSMLGTCQEVLIENSKTNDKLYKGVGRNYTKFIIESDQNIGNNIIEVKVSKIIDKKLFANFNI